MVGNLFYSSCCDLEKVIIPLKSNREQVERVIGQPKEKNCTECVYQTDKEKITVNYAIEECKGEIIGWNVPKDTVLSLIVEPREKLNESDVINVRTAYVKLIEHDFTKTYIDIEKGKVYRFGELNMLTSIVYLPTESNKDKRCRCYSDYNVAGIIYRPIITFGNPDINFGRTIIESHLIDIKESKIDVKTYLIVYSGNSMKSDDFQKYLSDMNDFLHKTLNYSSNDVELINGGVKDKFMADIYSIPKNYPKPVPSSKSTNCK